MNTWSDTASLVASASSQPQQSTREASNRRYAAWSLLLVLGVAALLWAPRLRGPIDLRYDAGVYFLLGTSLAEGNGYRIASEPGSPQAIQYPPLLPMLVGAHAKLLGTTDPLELGRWLRRSYFVLFLAFAAAVWALARTQLSAGWAAACAGLCLLQFNTYLLSDLLFSELPFALTCVAFVWVLTQATRLTLRSELLAFSLATASFLLRTAGIALLAAWVGEAILRRRWKIAAVRAVLSLIPFAGWQMYVMGVQASSEYQQPAYAYQRAPYQFYNVTYASNIALVDPFRPELGTLTASGMASRVLANLAAIPSAMGEAVSTSYGFWRWGLNETQDLFTENRPIREQVVLFPLWMLAVVSAFGLFVLARRGAWIFCLVVVGSIALVCATPWPTQFARYLSPLAAFLCISALVGSQRIYEKSLKRRSARGLLYGLGTVAVAIQVFTLVQIFARRQSDPPMPAFGRALQHSYFYHDQTWRDWEAAIGWIGEHAPLDAIVATTSPHLCYLWTGRHAIFPPMEADAAKARELLEAVPVSYVVVDELAFLDISRRYAAPAIENSGALWRLVFSVRDTRVYARDLAK